MNDILTNKIKEWCIEYNIDNECIICNFNDLKNRLGITYFNYPSKDLDKRSCNIEIKDTLLNNRFACYSVLWHEFNHTIPWIENGYTDGHNIKWVKRMLRKPWYIIGCVYAQIISIGK